MQSLFSLVCFLLLISFAAKAQNSDTYKIETLNKPEKLLKVIPAEDLYKKIEQNLIKISVKDDLVLNNAHPVLGGFLQAYKDHRPVTISPDIIWLLICQGFGQHVNNNSEQLRDKFVNFQGQKTLTVVREVKEGTRIKDFPWESVFPEFTQKIGDYTGQDLINVLSADFTTSTPATLIASQITIMESMKKYFKYKVIMVGCGIPEVTIEGTVEDWQKILIKLDSLSKYDLEWWTKELKPVIQEIINTKSGKFNKEFWMDMIKFHREGIYGSMTDIDGWFLKFYPYYSNGERTDLKKIKSIGDLPAEIVRVPFVLDLNIDKNTTIFSQQMEFWAGFMGLQQDNETYNLKPIIGWAINKVEEKAEISDFQKSLQRQRKREFDGDTTKIKIIPPDSIKVPAFIDLMK